MKKSFNQGKTLICIFFAILCLFSCSKDNENLVFSFGINSAFELPGGLAPFVTYSLVLPDQEGLHQLHDRLADFDLTLDDVRIEPQHCEVRILNNGTWEFADRASLHLGTDPRRLHPLYESNQLRRNTSSNWILLPFQTDISHLSNESFYNYTFRITPFQQSPGTLQIQMRTEYSVIDIR